MTAPSLLSVVRRESSPGVGTTRGSQPIDLLEVKPGADGCYSIWDGSHLLQFGLQGTTGYIMLDGVEVATIGPGGISMSGRPVAKYTTRALSSSTAAAGELTGAQSVFMNNSGATPGTYTTRTAAQMIADGSYQVGDSYDLRIINGQGTGVLTLAAGDANVTLTGTMTMAINTWRDFVVTITGAGTLTIQSAGTGTFS